MSSFTKTKGMKNQREKILSFFLIGKFKVSSTKPLFSRYINLSLYGFIAFKIVSFVRNISVEQFSSLANVLIYLWTAFFVTCKFYVFRNNKKRRDTNLRMDHFVVSSGKIQDIDKHENLTKPITNCNLSIVSFQTRKIRNGLRYPEMDLTRESKLGRFHQNQLVFVISNIVSTGLHAFSRHFFKM